MNERLGTGARSWITEKQTTEGELVQVVQILEVLRPDSHPFMSLYLPSSAF